MLSRLTGALEAEEDALTPLLLLLLPAPRSNSDMVRESLESESHSAFRDSVALSTVGIAVGSASSSAGEEALPLLLRVADEAVPDADACAADTPAPAPSLSGLKLRTLPSSSRPPRNCCCCGLPSLVLSSPRGESTSSDRDPGERCREGDCECECEPLALRECD